MPLDIQGILQSVQLASEQTTVLVPYLREIFINEFPLFTRLPHVFCPSELYDIITYDVRPRVLTLGAAITATGTANGTTTATLTLTDASTLMNGDVLEILSTDGSGFERVEVVAPSTDNVTVTVRRGASGTTPVANTTGTSTTLSVTLIGNSRTGAEINQHAIRSTRNQIPQAVQTSQFPVEIGGKAAALQNIALPAGISDVFSFEQKTKMVEMMRDIEYSGMFSMYQAPTAAGDRAKQAGLRQQIMNYRSGLNVNLAVGSNFTKLQFIAQLVQKCLDGGGDPDVIVCSTDFSTGLATWSVAQQTFQNPRQTPYLGIAVKEFDVAFTGGPLTLIPSYQMPKGTVYVGTSKDLRWRYIREAFFQKRGLQGDAWQGDFIGDYCTEIGHPGWHAWAQGITSFSAS